MFNVPVNVSVIGCRGRRGRRVVGVWVVLSLQPAAPATSGEQQNPWNQTAHSFS